MIFCTCVAVDGGDRGDYKATIDGVPWLWSGLNAPVTLFGAVPKFEGARKVAGGLALAQRFPPQG